MVPATSSSLADKSMSSQADNQLDRFCINEMRRWADEARLEAFSNIKRLEPDARGHQRTIGRSGALMLNSLVDGYGKSWVRDDWGPQWMWRTYWDWLELGIKRTSARIQRRNLGEDGDGLILEKEGICPTDGQVVNFFCIRSVPELFLKATDERLVLIEASGRRDRFAKRIRKSLMEQKAQVLRWMEGEDEPQQVTHDSRTARETDPPAQELLYLKEKDRDPLHNYEKKERSFPKKTLKKDTRLSLDHCHEPKKARFTEKVTDEDPYSSWETLCDLDPFGDRLRTLAQIMAEENKRGKVEATKLWRKLGRRYLKHRKERPHLSDEAWSEGFDAAVLHEAPNIGYVLKAAESFHRRG
jgi:hypothetical protein